MKKISLLICIVIFTLPLSAGINPGRLRCEYLENPQVIDVPNPRLSWINIAAPGERGQYQTAYQVRVASSEQLLEADKPDIWDSEKVISGQSFLVNYGGKALESRKNYFWQVRTWDRNGNVSGWSEPASWSMGLLDPAEWKAQWIGAPWQGEEPLPKPRPGGAGANTGQNQSTVPPPAPLLRKPVSIVKDIASARAYVTGLGFFELYVNGARISDDVLVPNLTLYGKRPGLENNYIPVPDNFSEYRVMYLSYDISENLVKGENVIGAIVGNGFYNVNSRWTQSYGSPRFIAQIHITYTDGTEDIITTDRSWKASKSAIVMDQIYEGEHYDARLEQPGWCNAGFDDSEWEPVAVRKAPEGMMKAHMAPTDRIMERLKPVTIIKNRDNKYYVDFGEEISGWVRLSGIRGKAGQVIDIEYLNESPVGANTYTLKGGDTESYAARFTWFVFRQVVISNWPGNLDASLVVAEAVYSDVPTTGEFESSNELFNKINRAWRRSQTDNMHGGITSDCPHRERSPYTGDGQVACITVMHNFDAGAFYTKWIQDINGARNPETGYVPNGAPWQPGCGGGVAWGAAINIMPWEFYMHYGDPDMLKNNYDGMKGYISYMLTWTGDDGIMYSQAPDTARPNRWLNLGDWCVPGAFPPDDMVHTFYLWRCADYTSKAAHELGQTEDAAKYALLAERTRTAFHKRFYDSEKGTYGAGGGNVFALAMGVPPDQYARVVASLRADIIANNGNLDTGIFGTQYLFEILAANGMNDLAYEAMNKRTQPSFGWWIEQGATTTWESWDGSNSRNHPMFGGSLVWFYRVLAGMNTDPDHPGYRNIIFRPQPAGDASFVSYSSLTSFGRAGIRWEKESGAFRLDIEVPVGSTADVYVPASAAENVTESGRKIKGRNGVRFQRMENGYAVYTAGSGTYNFRSAVQLQAGR